MRRVVGFALVAGLSLALVAAGPMADSAQALVPPTAVLPNAPASVLSAAGGDAAAAAELAGAGGVPATATAVMTSPAGVVVGGFALGFSVTTLGVKAFYKVTGQDLGAEVCSGEPGQGVISVLYGIDCSQYLTNVIPPASQNADTTATIDFSPSIGETSCNGSQCGTIYAIVPFTTATGSLFCVSLSWASSNGAMARYGPSSWYGGITAASTPVRANGASCPTDGTATRYTGFSSQSGSLSATAWAAQNNWSTTGAGVVGIASSSEHADPDRGFVTKVTTTDGSMYSCDAGGIGSSFKETSATVVPVCAPEVPSTKVPAEVTTTEHTLDGSAPDKQLTDQTTTKAYQDFATAQPDCGAGGCQYQIARKTSSGWLPCVVGQADCEGWFTDPQKSDDFECVDGPDDQPLEYVNTLSECNELSNYYDPQSQAEGKAYSDPATGAATGTSTSPDEDSAQMNESADDGNADESKSNCFPNGWGALNPLNWVLQPIQCAAKWAFIPKKSDIDAVNKGMNKAIAGSTVGSVLAIVGGWTLNGPFADSVAGCGIPVDIKWAGAEVNYILLNSCDGALKQPATIVHAVLSATIPVLGTLASLRYLAAIFGLRPFAEHAGRLHGGPTGPVFSPAAPEPEAPIVDMSGLDGLINIMRGREP